MTVDRGGADTAEPSVMLTHTILFGDRVVYEGKPESYDVLNGRRATIRKSLRAARRPGAFIVRVALVSGDAQGSGEVAFQIR